jgi:hypothetical protein
MEVISLEDIPAERVSSALGFDITDVDTDLQQEVVDT